MSHASLDTTSREGSPDGSPGRSPGGDGAAPEASPVVTATLSTRGFVDGWSHCQHVADYLARFAASDRFDPEQLTTRLSTYLNEVLELVFRATAGRGEPHPGDLVIAIHRLADRLQVEFRCPVDADSEGAARLRRSVRRATEPDAAALYRRSFADLLAPGAGADHGEGVGEEVGEAAAGEAIDGDGDAGLLELVALHGITLALREASDAVVLSMTVPHE